MGETLRHTKQRKTHRVPLNEGALDLLREIRTGQEQEVASAKGRSDAPDAAPRVPRSNGQPLREVEKGLGTIDLQATGSSPSAA